MRDQYMRAGEGFIICYSITDRRSFHEVREFKQLIYRVRRTDDTPVVLVGNKSDLRQLRQVRQRWRRCAACCGAGRCPFSVCRLLCLKIASKIGFLTLKFPVYANLLIFWMKSGL